MRLADVIYSVAVANGNNAEQFMTARKYYSMSLVLIDDVNADESQLPNNSVPRALFGLLKCCKAIKQYAKKVDEKNAQIEQVVQERLKVLYKRHTSIQVDKMDLFKQ